MHVIPSITNHIAADGSRQRLQDDSAHALRCRLHAGVQDGAKPRRRGCEGGELSGDAAAGRPAAVTAIKTSPVAGNPLGE